MAQARSAPAAAAESAAASWDTAYEWKAVTLLGIGFGLVGLDRWIIAPLFPFMAQDLGLDYQSQGNVVGVLGLAWGVFAIFSGRLSDSIGHRKVLIPAILLFSVLSGLTGLAAGLGSLIAIRALMGVMEGTYCPTSFTAVAAASRPSRRGFNQGLQQCGFALLGLGLGPIIATQLHVALITGPIATEAAPVGLISAAIGLVVGSGEIFGGGVAPSIAGFIAQRYGIENVLLVALTGVLFGLLVCLFLKETAPRKLALAETGPVA